MGQSRKYYRAQKYDTGDRVDVDLIPVIRIPSKNRQKRYKPTTEAQKNCNYYASIRYFQRLVHLNFSNNGSFKTELTYDNGWYPETEEQAERDIKNFIERMRYRYRASGAEMKYVYCISRGEETGRIHFHMILSGCCGIDSNSVKKIWGRGRRIKTEQIELGNLGCADLSAYMARQADVMKRRWVSSKNLKKPKPEPFFPPKGRFTKGDCEDFFKHNFTSYEIQQMFPGLKLAEEYECRYNAVNGEYYLHFRFYKLNAKIAWWGEAFDDAQSIRTYTYNGGAGGGSKRKKRRKSEGEEVTKKSKLTK